MGTTISDDRIDGREESMFNSVRGSLKGGANRMQQSRPGLGQRSPDCGLQEPYSGAKVVD